MITVMETFANTTFVRVTEIATPEVLCIPHPVPLTQIWSIFMFEPSSRFLACAKCQLKYNLN